MADPHWYLDVAPSMATTRHERWDAHWYRIFQDLRRDFGGRLSRDEARAVADRETELALGPRPA